MDHKPVGPLALSPLESPRETTSCSRQVLTLVRSGTDIQPQRDRKLVDALEEHLSQSNDYVLEGEDEYPCKEAPEESVQPRILGQDYNQGLASWLRSCCPLKTRDDRVRPVVWFTDAEDYKGRRQRSQDMKGRVAVFKKPSDLPPHWNPKLESRTEGFEGLIRPPTLRQVLAKGLVEMYERGDRLKPRNHVFRCRLHKLMKEHREEYGPTDFVGPLEYAATVNNEDVVEVLIAQHEADRLRMWLMTNHLKRFNKKVDQPFREVINAINRKNPTRVVCNQVTGYIRWLRNNTEHLPDDEARLDQWLKGRAAHSRTCLELQKKLKKQRLWKCALKRYMLGKGTTRQLTALSKLLFDDGRQHVELAPPSGHVKEDDRIFYNKCVSQYLEGNLSPHRIMRLYKYLFPNGRDSKGLECNIIPIGKPITRYIHSFHSERLLHVNRDKLRWDRRALGHVLPSVSFKTADEPEVITKDESRLSDLITSKLLTQEEVMSYFKDKFEEFATKLSAEVSLTIGIAADMVTEKILQNQHEHKPVPGYDIDPISGLYRPITT